MTAPPRSWLFVPADSEKKIAKALASDADALIFALEDSVAPDRKAVARDILKQLPARSGGPLWWVRINPLGSDQLKADLTLLASADFAGIVLPKAESGADVTQLARAIMAFAGGSQAGDDAASAKAAVSAWAALRPDLAQAATRTVEEIEAGGGGWTFAKLTIANAALRELAAEAASGRKRRAG